MLFNAKLLVVLTLRAPVGSSLQVQSEWDPGQHGGAFHRDTDGTKCGRATGDTSRTIYMGSVCEEAATYLGLTYMTMNDPTLPRGCFVLTASSPGRIALSKNTVPSGYTLAIWNDAGSWDPDPWLPEWVLVCKNGSVPHAVGDPHMMNIRGESFEVRKPGVHTFLTMPQNSNVESALLQVDALLLGDDCSALFIKRINIAGRWLGSVPPLAFTADGAGEGQAEGPGLRLGNSSFLTMEQFMSRVPRKMIKMDLPGKAIETPTLANTHATTMAATVKFDSGVDLKVSWVTERTQASHLVKSLWLTSKGLSSVNMPIGGLLGTDDHSLVSEPCHNMPSGMRMGKGYTVASAEQ